MFKHFPHDYHGMDCVVALIIVFDFRKKFMAREAHNWLKNSSRKGNKTNLFDYLLDDEPMNGLGQVRLTPPTPNDRPTNDAGNYCVVLSAAECQEVKERPLKETHKFRTHETFCPKKFLRNERKQKKTAKSERKTLIESDE